MRESGCREIRAVGEAITPLSLSPVLCWAFSLSSVSLPYSMICVYKGWQNGDRGNELNEEADRGQIAPLRHQINPIHN